MNEKEFDSAILLAKTIRIAKYDKEYYKEKVEYLDRLENYDEVILAIVWPMDIENQAKLFELWNFVWIDIHKIRSECFYK